MTPNVILVLIDSLNRHQLRPYAPDAVPEVPNLQRFAARARRFDNHFVGSLPCMPARREIYSGRREMLWRPWGPLEPFDARLPRQVAERGYTTAIVTDHYHYWEEEANGYLQAFASTQLIRGHENDNWHAPVRPDQPVPAWVENIERYRPGKGRGYYANVRDFNDERDYFPAKVMTGAASWLERNARSGPFFLQVESFDVHEPFDVPEPYASMYGDRSDRARFDVWPPYQDPTVLERFMAATTPEELTFIRSQYAAKLTMVDRWFGTLLDRLDALGLWDDTAVIVTTDHGHDLGERGAFGKQWPHYDSHANIPLFMWHPELEPTHEPVTDLTTTVDLYATVLELAGAEVPPAPGHSRSLLPLLRGDGRGRRALTYGTFGQGVAVTDGRWTLLKSPAAAGPLFSYSTAIFRSLTANHVREPAASGHFINGVELPQWKIPIELTPLTTENHLYDRVHDPLMKRNLWHEEASERDRMLRLLVERMRAEGAPAEQFERLGLEGNE